MVRREGSRRHPRAPNGMHTFCLVSVTIPGKNRPAVPFHRRWALCFQGRRFIENGNSGGESNSGSLVGNPVRTSCRKVRPTKFIRERSRTCQNQPW
jgi:hypothetical protein